MALLFSINAHAIEHCDQKMEEVASLAASKINSLTDLEAFYRKYKICVSDADVSEEYDEAISQLLVKHWSNIVRSKKLKRPEVVEAIRNGVSETWEYNTSKKLFKLAKEQCSDLAKPICAEILDLENRISRH